jgi:hypothetical protein
MDVCTRPGVEHLFVVDSVFNLPLRHAKEVCRELAARGPLWQHLDRQAFS